MPSYDLGRVQYYYDMYPGSASEWRWRGGKSVLSYGTSVLEMVDVSTGIHVSTGSLFVSGTSFSLIVFFFLLSLHHSLAYGLGL